MRTLALVLLAALLASACGEPESPALEPAPAAAPAPEATPEVAAPEPAPAVAPTPEATPEVAARGRIEALLDVARQGEAKDLLPFVAVRGEGEDRRYRAAGDSTSDVQEATRFQRRIAKHLAAGEPTFDRFETQAKREQEWLAWHVKFGEGASAVQAIYALVDVGGSWYLGDID